MLVPFVQILGIDEEIPFPERGRYCFWRLAVRRETDLNRTMGACLPSVAIPNGGNYGKGRIVQIPPFLLSQIPVTIPEGLFLLCRNNGFAIAEAAISPGSFSLQGYVWSQD